MIVRWFQFPTHEKIYSVGPENENMPSKFPQTFHLMKISQFQVENSTGKN